MNRIALTTEAAGLKVRKMDERTLRHHYHVVAPRQGLRWPVLLAILLAGPGCSSNDDSSVVPPDDSAVSTINTSNFEPLLEFLFTIANAEILDPVRASIDDISGDDINGVPEALDYLTETSSRYDPDTAVVHHDYDCQDGGTYAFANPGYAVGGGSGVFDDCQYNGKTMNGSYLRTHTLVKYVYSPGWTTTITYSDLGMITSADATTREMEASLDHFVGENENTELWNVSEFTQGRDDEEVRLSDVLLQLYAGDQADNPDYNEGWMRSLSSRFTVQAPQTGNQVLTVTTEDKFVTRSRTDSYTEGVLQVLAEDGSELRLTADNGDPNTFQVDISDGGTMSSFTLPWHSSLRLRCLASPEDTDVLSGNCK